jgi:hypothetical protein
MPLLAKKDDIFAEFDYDVALDISEAEIYKARNDWTENPDGKGYLSALDNGRQGSPQNQGGAGFDLDRQELEEEFGRLIQERTSKSGVSASPSKKGGAK